MESIVLTDDELKRLEKRLGPAVREMGPWSSDGVFGFATVSIVAVEKASEALQNSDLSLALPNLKSTSERSESFIEILEHGGSVLVEKIVAAYRGCF